MTELFNTTPQISAWLDLMGVERYFLTPDSQYGFVVNVESNVDLSEKKFKESSS